MNKFKFLILTFFISHILAITVAHSGMTTHVSETVPAEDHTSEIMPTVSEVQEAMAQNNSYKVEQLSKEVLAEDPNSAKAHYFLGEAYYHEGKLNKAHQELLSAKSLDPNLAFTNNPAFFYGLLNNSNYAKNIIVKTNDHFSWWVITLYITTVIMILLLIYMVICLFRKPKRIDYHTSSADNLQSNPSSFSNGRSSKYSSNSTSSCPPTVNHNYYSSPSYQAYGNNGFVEGLVVGEILADANHSQNITNETINNYDSRSSSYTDTSSYDSNSSWDRGVTDSSSSWDSGSSSSSWDSSSSDSSSW